MHRWRRPSAAVVAVALSCWPILAASRLYDPDEFEHLHAAVAVAGGQTPYRDFFEHHGPLTYYLLGQFPPLFGLTPDLLHVHRASSGIFLFLILLGVRALLREFGVRNSWPAWAWLLTFPWFVEKAVEGRPDMPAAALSIWTVWAAVRGAKAGAGWAFLAGLLLATAALFTQKVALAGVGAIVGAAVGRLANRRPIVPALVAGAGGFALPWAMAAGYFASRGALEAFVERVVWLPISWPAHAPRPDEGIWPRLCNGTTWAPGHLVLAAVGLLAMLPRLRRLRSRARGEAVPALAALVHLAAAPAMPAAYLQYYLLAWPSVAVCLGRTFPLLLRRCGWRLALLCSAAFAVGWTPYMPVGRFDVYLTLDRCAAIGFVLAVFVCAAICLIGRRSWFVALAIVATLVPGVGRIVIQYTHWNFGARQRTEVAEFSKKHPGPVLDGFTGLGCLSPHASYWWWINHHSIPLMRKEGAVHGLVDLVWRRVPAVVVYDENLQSFGNGLPEALERGYDLQPQRFAGRRLWVRRGPPP